MADPLSVSASIAGLITITDVVFSRTFKYVKAVKGAPSEVSSLTLALGALSGILHNLRLVASQFDGEPFDTAMQISHIHSCFQTVEKAEKILDKYRSSSAGPQNMERLKRLKWPFSVSEAKTLSAEIERHKTTLSLALNVDSMANFLHALSKQKDLQNEIDDINSQLRQKHAAETRIAASKERRKVLDWIQPYDPHQNHEMSLSLRHPGTGLWFIESDEFKAWLSCSRAKLWCYGIPGAGKTVLASSVIQEALGRSSPNTAVAFFYCDYKNATTQDPRNILGSLACQIAVQDEQSFGKLQTFYAKQNPPDRPPIGFDPEDLRDLLVEMASSFNDAMIVVDALDECGTQSAFVTRLLSSLNDNGDVGSIKTLFLSRHEQDIREVLEDYDQVSIAARSSDLKIFVGAEIECRTRNKSLRIKDESLKQHIMERLVDDADGMFRWVSCQMDHLCLLPNDAARRRALTMLPPTLHATYERILSRVNNSNKEVQKLVQRSLRWLVCSKKQLCSSALCEAISIDTRNPTLDRTAIPDEDEILRWCSSLVRKSASGESLELAHFTVKEFLTTGIDTLDSEYGVYHFGTEIDNAQLAETCLTYLCFEDFGSGSRDSNYFNYNRWAKFAFRQYAVEYWADHARNNLKKPEIMSLTQQLLHPSKPLIFVSWTQDFIWTYYGYDLNTCDYVSLLPGADLATASPLHFAAMLALPESCEWLLQKGCSVDQSSIFGTPLECALLGEDAVIGDMPDHTVLLDVSRRSTVTLIIDRGADLQKTCDRWGSSMLRRMLRRNPACQDQMCHMASYLVAYTNYEDLTSFHEMICAQCRISDRRVQSDYNRAVEKAFLAVFPPQPSAQPSPDIYVPQKRNVLVSVVKMNNPALLKLLLRRLPKELIPTLLAHRDQDWGTLLYVAATQPAEKTIHMLLDAGADLELEGGEHGTPLLGACAAGRLSIVKVLVLKGARTSYAKEGEVFSALLAARNHGQITRWLLVGRFLEGPLLIENGKT